MKHELELAMSLTLLAPPASEPISLDDLKAHLRITHTDEDALIASLGMAARQSVEARAGLALMPQQWRLGLDAAPDAVYFPLRPVLSVDAVTVSGPDDTVVHVPADAYETVTGLSGRLSRSGQWPRPHAKINGVKIDFTIGWSSIDLIPDPILQAVKLLAGHFYEHREAASRQRTFTIPDAADALLAPYKEVRL